MPGARCTRSLACEKNKAHERSHREVHRRNPAFPHADGFNAYIALSSVNGLSCHRRLANCFAKLDTSVGASGPHDFAVRACAARLAPPPRPPHPAPNVRDDRANAPHVRRDGVDIVLIWGKREAKYFFGRDWTGSIRLKRLEKLAFWRRAFASFLPSSGTCRSSPSVRYLFLQTLPKWCN